MVEKQLSVRLRTFRWRLRDYAARFEQHSRTEVSKEQISQEAQEQMKRTTIVFTLIFVVAAVAMPLFTAGGAQTRNQSSKVQLTEFFVFPNECTDELMDVYDTTTITCHDQLRADGRFSEKCEIRQDVTATGESTGITWNGTATFKDEFVATDPCNFSFSNRGKVPLISRGSSVNTFISFDDLVVMQNCNLTADQHVVSVDCRGNGKP